MKLDKIVIFLLILFFPFLTGAETDQMQAEIDHMINYIRSSDCNFIRNGKKHSPEAAVEHILKKYDYFKTRITTTEEFIEYCATKSSMSGKPYKIVCPGPEVVESKLWLLKELQKFRCKDHD
jgi:hypothetical protein